MRNYKKGYQKGYKKGQREMLLNVIRYLIVEGTFMWIMVDAILKIAG